MAIIQIQLTFNSVNVSAQVGDIAYYSQNGNANGGFNNTALSNTITLGVIVGITPNSITVSYDNAFISPPPEGSFISFAKDKTVNTSSLVGYYAQVDFENNSKDRAELFSVGSEVAGSSK
jgi:hypothetical protein|tara:strand:+ start:408 stop:767 length:360 start_codon:yes stop_codon:yes gene_type:complete